MRRSLLKALIPAAPQRPASLVRGLGLGRVALRHLPMVPCAALHATGIDSALHSARLRQAASGPQRVLKSLRPASLSLFSTNSFPGRFARFVKGGPAFTFGLLCTGLATGAALAGWYSQQKEAAETRQKTIETSEIQRKRLEVEAILAARAPPSSADRLNRYMKRSELEETLTAFLQKPITSSGKYLVVFGPRGAGKTTLVSHVLKKMDDGVLFVPVTEKAAN
mmetsp:Transcript_30578/g.97623  ORF Transcript_30578/g.97623 Transcript_30578/m.97623 type:complete len:223 (+) Transcript_30578:1504-2172(+)